MKVRFPLKLILVCLLLIAGGCSKAKPDKQSNGHSEAKAKQIDLTISAAASLEDVLKEIKPLFEEKYKNINLFFNFGGSGTLKKQIIQGAPVDVFFSSAEDQFDELVKNGMIDKEHSVDLLQNTLVLIIPKESKGSIGGFNDLSNLGKGMISIGTPEAVPAGHYGKQLLQYLNLWNQVEANLVFAKDVRQVLTYVETGNVEAGLVYKTDALNSDKVKLVAEADPKSHDRIIYPVGIINTTAHNKESELFYQFLQEEISKKAFKKYGFNVLD